MSIKTQLLDARTDPKIWARACTTIAGAQLLGLDCETQDEDRHTGLQAFCKGNRHAFDTRRIVMTGFSFFAEGDDVAYYVNLAHADVENRVTRGAALELLQCRRPGSVWLAHNAPFELMSFGRAFPELPLDDLICTLQLAVSSHGPDEYAPQVFAAADLSAFRKIAPDVLREFESFDPEKQSARDLNPDQAFVLSQFLSKQSKAGHSYNGFVDSIAYGYGLKKLVKSLFGHNMPTYAETLKRHGAAHMGELTGDQVAEYGADDAYWCLQVYKTLIDRMMKANPAALVTFFEGEAPMARVFADAWTGGLRLNTAEIRTRQAAERKNAATILRTLKSQIAALLPFPEEPSAALIEHQSAWYPKHYKAKRAAIEAWAGLPDSADDFEQCFQISNPVGNAWATDKGFKNPEGRLNLGHYFIMRTLLHDLMGHKLVRVGGDITTDAEARGRMRVSFEKQGNAAAVDVLTSIDALASLDTTMKLYLTPYLQLLDPETGRVYPNITSMLATRRLAMSNPNAMQLAKSGESTYVRGFFQGDDDEHVVISADWSSIELVLIGEASGDPGFLDVFSTDPYGDLHSRAAVVALQVDPDFSDITVEEFKFFKQGENPNGRHLKNFDGSDMTPASFFKLYRSTEVGKGINFGYWFSGACGTVAERLGWSSDTMWKVVEGYREEFSLAEAWRTGVIDEVRDRGFITLPDGHRRVRLEATRYWGDVMRRKFGDVSASPAMGHFADICIKRIQSRAGNQAVNARIQGMCARLAKDSVLGMRENAGHLRARFLFPVHDELVYSVHQDDAAEFIPILRSTMCSHPKYVQSVKLLCNVAVGKTFQPYNESRPAYSQIELDEAPEIAGVIGREWRGKQLPPEKVAEVLDYIKMAA